MRLANVDVLKGTFTLDGYVYISYRDDRFRSVLGYKDGDKIDPTLFADCVSSCTHRPAVYWSPRPEVINDGTGVLEFPLEFMLRYNTPYWLTGDEAAVDLPTNASTPAWVEGFTRLFVELSADFNLRDFPFDWHDVGLHLESRNTQFKELRWVPAATLRDSLMPPVEVAGWDVLGVGSSVSDYYYNVENTSFSHMHIYVRLVRQPSIYNLRFTLGSVLLITMAFMTFLIKPDEPDRLGFANACFLGIVSWQFILVSSTPALGYATRMDDFLVMSLVFITGTYMWNTLHAGYWGSVAEDAPGKPAPRESRAGEDEMYNYKTDGAAGSAGAAGTLSTPTRRPSRVSRVLKALDDFGHAGEGYWATLGVHRKLDLLAMIVFSVGYIIASSLIMAGGLDHPGTPTMTHHGVPIP